MPAQARLAGARTKRVRVARLSVAGTPLHGAAEIQTK